MPDHKGYQPTDPRLSFVTPTLTPLAEMAKAQPALRLLLDTAAFMRDEAVLAENDLSTADADAIGGALLEQEMAVEMSAKGFDRVMAQIAGLDQADQRAALAAKAAGQGLSEILGLPAPVRDAALNAQYVFYATVVRDIGCARCPWRNSTNSWYH